MAANFAPTQAELSLVQAIFTQTDTQKLGIITGDVAVKVFGGANLAPTTLGEIWTIADEDNNGWLSKKGVAIAIRLMGWAQKGERVTKDLVNKPGPVPQIDGVVAIAPQNTGMSAPKSPPPPVFPPLTPQDRSKFLGIFQKAGPGPDGLLSSNAARDIFVKSRLSNDQLLRVWQLADTNDRGSLDSTDFIVAMYFIQGLMSKTIAVLPNELPPGLVQQARGQAAASTASIRSHTTGGSNSGSFTPLSGAFPQNRSALQPQYTGQTLQPNLTGRSHASVPPALPARPTPAPFGQQANGSASHWDVTASEKAASDRYFEELDPHHTGYADAVAAEKFLRQSNLGDDDLARIWDLSDLSGNGQLTKDGFAIAMHLIQKKLSGTPLPDALPQSLIPPAMRSKAAPSFSSPFSPVQAQHPPQQPEAIRDLLWDDTPPSSATAPQPPQPNIFDKTPVPPHKTPDPFGSSSSSTFAPPRDLLFDEDEPIAAASPPLQDKSAEIGNAQNQLSSTNRSLETAKNERAALEETLASQATQLASLQTQLSSAKAAYETESKLLATLRERQANQTAEIQKTREELIRAESDLSAVRVEKAEIEGAFLRDKEDARDLHRKMIETGQQAESIKVEIEKAKKDAKQQKGLLAIAKKQLSTKEAERAKAQKELEEAQAEVASIAKEKDDTEAEVASISASLASLPQVRATSPDSLTFAASQPLPVSPEPTSPNGSILSAKSNNPFDRLTRGGGTPRSQSPFQTLLPSPSAVNTSVPEPTADHDPFGFADAFESKDVKEEKAEQLAGETGGPQAADLTTEASKPAPVEVQSNLGVDETPHSAGTTENEHDFFTPPTSANQTAATSSPQFTSLDDVASKFPVIEAEDHKIEPTNELIKARPSVEPVAEHPDATDLAANLKELEIDESDSDSDSEDEVPLSELQKSKSAENQNNAVSPPQANGAGTHEPAADNAFDAVFGDSAAAPTTAASETAQKQDNDFDQAFFSSPATATSVSEVVKDEPAGANAFDEAMGTIPASATTTTQPFSFDSAFDDNFDFASATKTAPTVANTEPPKPETFAKANVPDFGAFPAPPTTLPTVSPNGKAPEQPQSKRQTSLFDETFMGLDTNTPSLDLKTSFTPPQPAAPEPASTNPFPTSSEVRATPTSPVRGTPSILPDSPLARPSSPPVRTASPKPRLSSSSSKEVHEKQKDAPTRRSGLSIRLPFGKKKKQQQQQQQHEPLPSTLLTPPLETGGRTPTPAVDDDVESVKQLTSMGFSRSQAVEALERNAYDVQRALNSLLGN